MNKFTLPLKFILTLVVLMLATTLPVWSVPGKGLAQQVADLQATVAALEARLEDIECVSTDSDAMNVIFEGCNVHVRNGVGTTNSINGRGNLIVGYDRERTIRLPSDKTGSHNLIVGDDHNYSSYGGLVSGLINNISAEWASVSGGESTLR